MLMVPKGKQPQASSIEEALELGDKAPSVRIQLTLKPEFARRLQDMRQKSRASSYSELIRDALRIHECLLKSVGPDDQLLVRKKDGSMIQLVI